MGSNRLSRLPTSPIAAAGLLLGLALACFAPTGAAAQQGTINPEQACRDDAFRLCNDFIPNRDKVGACLRAKARALSRDCHTVIFGAGTHKGTRKGTHKRHHRQH